MCVFIGIKPGGVRDYTCATAQPAYLIVLCMPEYGSDPPVHRYVHAPGSLRWRYWAAVECKTKRNETLVRS